jgi:type I restriction enzyme S subunit
MAGWRTATLFDLVALQRGFDITKAQQRPGQVPVVSSSGVSSYHDEAKAPGPGVVIGRKGTLGTVFFLGEPFWPHDTTLWVTDFKGNDPKFAFYFLKTMGLQQFDVGAANPTLNRNHIHGLPIRIPPVSVQHRIAGVLSAYDDLIENNTRRIKILEEMARSLYREWFVEFRYPGSKSVPRDESTLGPLPRGWRARRLAVTAGLRGSHFHRDHRYPGPERDAARAARNWWMTAAVR